MKVQEDFKDYGGVTLEKLDIYISACDAVVHLVGDMTGAAAKPASTQAILAKYPDLVERLPPLRPPLERDEDISYTQWEAWLALYHGKVLLITQADKAAPRGPNFAPTGASRAPQQAHLDRLRPSSVIRVAHSPAPISSPRQYSPQPSSICWRRSVAPNHGGSPAASPTPALSACC